MPDDFNAQLASHEDIIRHLVALCTRMDTVIDALRERITASLCNSSSAAQTTTTATEAAMPDAALATLQDRLDALCAFVGYDPASHAPLDELVTLEDRLRTMDTAVELMQGQLAEVLALVRGTQVQINERLERLLAEVIRQRQGGHANGGSHA